MGVGHSAQVRPSAGRLRGVHFERLVIEACQRTYALDLHRRLTVIAGVGQLERKASITELIGGLERRPLGGPSRDRLRRRGAATPSSGRRAGRHRVVDIDRSADVTDDFMTPEGLDVLRRAGIDGANARRQLCVSPDDLATRSQLEHYLAALARIDQGRLWDVAAKVEDRERRLAQAARAAGSDAEDVVMYAEIERRHQDFEQAQDDNERVRYLSFIGGAGGALVGMAVAAIYGFWFAVPFLLVAIAATAASIAFWRRLEQRPPARRGGAARRGRGVLSHLPDPPGQRPAGQRPGPARHDAGGRGAPGGPGRVAGPGRRGAPRLGRQHRTEIRQQARRLRNSVGPQNAMAPMVLGAEDNRAELAHALLQRLQQLKSLGAGGESFPLLLDDALTEVDPGVKPELLELLTKASLDQQIIYLTEDADVASWARVEALTGHLEHHRAGLGPSGRRAGQPARRRRSNHIAV